MNQTVFLREIAFLAVVLNIFPNSKIDFWPFLKLQLMEFSEKKIVKLICLITRGFFLAWTF